MIFGRSHTYRVEALRVIASVRLEAATFAVIRGVQLGSLVVLSVALARLMDVHQYALYARGSFFANMYSTVMLMGQDQLIMRGRLSVRAMRMRALPILGVTTLVVIPLAAVTVPNALLVIAVSALGTAAMVVVYGETSLRLYQGRYISRSWLLLANAVTIQTASVAMAAIGGGALGVTMAGTVTSLAWLLTLFIQDRSARSDQVAESAPFREGAWIGLGALLYGLIPTIAGLVVAIRAPDRIAGEDRFVLLAFSGLVAICSALNTEYFRSRLFRAANEHRLSRAVREMQFANVVAGGVLALLLPLGALILAVALRGKYGGAAVGVALIAGAIPFLLASQVQTNVELVAGRWRVPLARTVPAVVSVTILVVVLPPTVLGMVTALVASEACGLMCFYLLRRRLGPRDLLRVEVR